MKIRIKPKFNKKYYWMKSQKSKFFKELTMHPNLPKILAQKAVFIVLWINGLFIIQTLKVKEIQLKMLKLVLVLKIVE